MQYLFTIVLISYYSGVTVIHTDQQTGSIKSRSSNWQKSYANIHWIQFIQTRYYYLDTSQAQQILI